MPRQRCGGELKVMFVTGCGGKAVLVVDYPTADVLDWDDHTANTAMQSALDQVRPMAELAHGIVRGISTVHIEKLKGWQGEQQNAASAAAAQEGRSGTFVPTDWDDFKTFDIKPWSAPS